MYNKKIAYLVAGALLLFVVYMATPFILARFGFYESRLDQLQSEIINVVDVAATDVSQCKVVGLGSRACGGVDSYLVYSVSSTDENRLLSLVREYNELDKKNDDANGYMSICSIAPIPSLELKDGRCVAVEY